MEVYLVRHGPAEARDPLRWPDDDDRPLRSEGVEESRRAARGFARLGRTVPRVVTSPAERARATAALFHAEIAPRRAVATWPELAPGSPASPVLARLADVGAAADGWLLVGHEPILSELIGLALTGEAVSVVHFARAGAAALAFDGSILPGAGRLDFLLTRRQLAAIAAGAGR